MIKANCLVNDTLPYTALLPFQGGLKSHTDENIKVLARSLKEEGQKTPFFIWHKPIEQAGPHEQQPHYMLDGHKRHLAIQLLASEDPEVLSQEYPVVIIVEPTIEEAKNTLLQICSTYGKITPKGLQEFIKGCSKIKLENTGVKVKLPGVKVNKERVTNDYIIMHLKIKKDRVKDVTAVLSNCSYVEIL